MNLIKTYWINGDIKQSVVEQQVPRIIFRSITILRDYLVQHAGIEFGHKEGRDFRIVQCPKGCLIPIKAVAPNGDTLTIE